MKKLLFASIILALFAAISCTKEQVNPYGPDAPFTGAIAVRMADYVDIGAKLQPGMYYYAPEPGQTYKQLTESDVDVLQYAVNVPYGYVLYLTPAQYNALPKHINKVK
jgi:hypothetical protein